jgi:signal transduction histidine kinase
VIENHGGTVNVSSELGRGTSFEVRLPAAAT